MKRALPLYDASIHRRSFLEMAAAAAVVVGAGACTRERGQLLPYSREPPALVPGNALSYATSLVTDGFATGVLVQSREGRPIKVEGNPDHPASLGATGVFEQATLMQLYDPERPRTVIKKGKPDAWRSYLRWAQERVSRLLPQRGAGLHFLLEPSGSPLLGSLKQRIRERLPLASFHSYAPLFADGAAAAALTAFGRRLETRYALEQADVIVSLDADFLGTMPDQLRYSRAFADRRVPRGGSMNRLYVFEAQLSLTGMMADHRLAVRSADVQDAALSLLGAVLDKRPAGQGDGTAPASLTNALRAFVASQSDRQDSRVLKAVAADLMRASGRSVVIAGPRQPPAVHVVAHALNQILGNQGKTVFYSEPVLDDDSSGAGALLALSQAIDAGQVGTLVIGAFDPVYTAPSDLDFAARLGKVETSIYYGQHYDSTGAAASWFIPAAHAFESWGDARGPDGTVSLQQPLIEPLFGGVTQAEVLASFLEISGTTARVLLRDYWQSQVARADFDDFWQEALRRGLIEGTAAPSITPTFAWDQATTTIQKATNAAAHQDLELNLLPSLCVWDGRHADNGWLLELPEPITQISWDNAATMSPRTAHDLGVETGSVVSIERAGRTVRAPVMVLPMQADGTICLSLGYGRQLRDTRHKPVGFDAYPLRTVDAPWFTDDVRVTLTADRHAFANAQPTSSQEGRPLALETTLSRLDAEPHMFEEHKGELPSLYDPFTYQGYRWGMAIDLTRCIGCAACVVACEAENNSPVVGRDEIAKGRAMQWIHIDRYFTEHEETGRVDVITQPRFCVHCEHAPCEYVCPVNATVHSEEGLNQMVYNRCVGTRFCSNNCPYKVRRFNYLAYQKNVDPLEAMRMNPEVTVRSRGVMEKCTYCVQRIERVRIKAENESRPIGDGEVVTACSQVCPTQAIVFGSLHDPAASVSVLHADPRSYALLHELGTRPRTRHLARVRNPNPELVG